MDRTDRIGWMGIPAGTVSRFPLPLNRPRSTSVRKRKSKKKSHDSTYSIIFFCLHTVLYYILQSITERLSCVSFSVFFVNGMDGGMGGGMVWCLFGLVWFVYVCVI